MSATLATSIRDVPGLLERAREMWKRGSTTPSIATALSIQFKRDVTEGDILEEFTGSRPTPQKAMTLARFDLVDWTTPGLVERCRELWAHGEVKSKIIAIVATEFRQKISDAALAGYVNRNRDLFPARKSPIVRSSTPRRERSEGGRLKRNTIQALMSAPAAGELQSTRALPSPAVIEDALPSRPRRAMLPDGCCWPLWQEGSKPGMKQRYCDEPHEAGRPYCEEHTALARLKRS